jgi:3-oxoacyl-[acyl-carrier-protein] synthase II
MSLPKCYINGMGCVSPQATFDKDTFLDAPIHYDQQILTCVVPEFKKYINPVMIRRMNRIIRIGMSAARMAIDEAGLTMPDAIITATGYGCADDTIKFLEEIIHNGEKELTPTYFTQSTYNALSGLIALSLKCNNYNTTYVHRAFAFESAVLDTMLQLAADPTRRVLVGGYDESNQPHYLVTSRVGYYKMQPTPANDLYSSGTSGTIQGEGAAFFAVSAQPTATSYAAIDGVKTMLAPTSTASYQAAVEAFLAQHDTQLSEIDLIISGRSGCIIHDAYLTHIEQGIASQIPKAYYKHLIGDYSVTSTFATWLAARILQEQRVPAALLPTASPSQYRRILYLNQYMGAEYTMMLYSGL